MEQPIKVRNGRNYDRNAASRRVAIKSNAIEDPTPTIQSAKDDSDINVIVRRFGVLGPFPAGARLPTYGDFTQIVDFSSAMQAVRKGQEEFMELPATLREKFGNDPQRFLEFCTNPENEDELRKLGLLKPKEEPAIVEREVEAVSTEIEEEYSDAGVRERPVRRSGEDVRAPGAQASGRARGEPAGVERGAEGVRRGPGAK